MNMIEPTNPDYTNTPASAQRPDFGYVPADALAAPYVTIVTPFYNTGPVFHETATSVLRQSFQQWEWLIVNDGSTDPQSPDILDTYRRKDPRIRVIDHETNRGLSAARNTGFRGAQTEYVVQLDADDLLEPTAIEKWVWFLESYPEYGFVNGYTVGFGAQEYLWQQGFYNGKKFLVRNLVAPTSMIRRAVYEAANGYDEANRRGLEDWDFWLRCANAGHWGATVPEYLDWYRWRPAHRDRWSNWDEGKRQQAFRRRLRQRYPRLWQRGGFPDPTPHPHLLNATVPDALPFENHLDKFTRRLLMIVPWFAMGGADKFNQDLIEYLTQHGWQVTIAATLTRRQEWLSQFARHTPDIFVLGNFLQLVDYPRFLHYLVESRRPDAVLLSNSELGYLLLPYLRAHYPDLPILDLCHTEEEWKNGGYPRFAIEYQEMLELNIVTSDHLKCWMVARGARIERIKVCYTCVATEEAECLLPRRAEIRSTLNLPDPQTVVILYAARLCPQKQPRVLARTLLRLSQDRLDFVALVVGDGEDYEWLKYFVRKHRLSQVRLLGALPNARVKELMAAADVFFLPSAYEGIALSIYEAMAFGLPVLGADVGGQRELVMPECGVLLARSDEVQEVARYATILAEWIQQPEKRRAMGQSGQTRIRTHFRLEQMRERMLALFEHAKQLNSLAPRPAVGPGLGRVCATRAIEYLRMSRVAVPVLMPGRERSLRSRLYLALRWRLLRYYNLGLSRGLGWLRPLKDWLRKRLLG
jgi:glycosyltransferase involved in cell wall biosynthesis